MDSNGQAEPQAEPRRSSGPSSGTPSGLSIGTSADKRNPDGQADLQAEPQADFQSEPRLTSGTPITAAGGRARRSAPARAPSAGSCSRATSAWLGAAAGGRRSGSPAAGRSPAGRLCPPCTGPRPGSRGRARSRIAMVASPFWEADRRPKRSCGGHPEADLRRFACPPLGITSPW